MNNFTKIKRSAFVFRNPLHLELWDQTTSTWCLNGTSTDSNIGTISIFAKLILVSAFK
jgi:hypothetical protein